MLRPDTVLFFEAKGGLNLTGSQELIDVLETEFADIILANGRSKMYWVQEKGVSGDNYKFVSARWKVQNE